jgi:hypothetical protein
MDSEVQHQPHHCGIVITIQQECVVLKYRNAFLSFYWPFGFDIVQVESVIPNPNPQTSRHIPDGLVGPIHMSVEEAHQLFDTLMDAGAY